ncbi:MAG: DUF2846 domain-containing protein [Deltaproteobacteria bacterium]|nr:DUF2846 domain-containing protein [Deltaproteobacteria bacterium]
MRVTKRWLAAALLLLLGGCATAHGPGFEGWKKPETDVGLVYLYRPWSFVGGLLPVRVHVDGERKGDLENGTHQVHELPPGPHTIVAEMGSLPITTDKITIEVKVEAGSVLYARFKARRKDVGGGTTVRLSELTVVNADTARREIPDTKRAR